MYEDWQSNIYAELIDMVDTHENVQENFLNKNLLIITPLYPNEDDSYIGGTFVKNQVAVLKKYFNRIIIIAPVLFSMGYMKKDRLCRDYSYEGVDVYYPRCFYIPIFWLKKFYIDNRLKVVERIINKNDMHFDLIHAHFTWPSGYIGVKLSEKYGKPVITTIHENSDWFDQEVKMDHPLINSAWSEADALIRVNRKDVPILQRYNDNVYSIPNGFSSKFHPIDKTLARKMLGIDSDCRIVFSLGNLVKRKGFDYLIDAMEQICKQREDILCYIGGAGPEKEKLLKKINRLNMNKNVWLLGQIPEEQLILWMNACDIFVLPSLSEGNPTVMFEAIGCGRPFIGTNVGGVSEIINSNEYGSLVEPANSKDLADKIVIALNKEWDWELIATHSEHYSWENIVKEVIKAYCEVM